MAATMNPAWLTAQGGAGGSRAGQVQPANSPQVYGSGRAGVTTAFPATRGGSGGFTPRQATGSETVTAPIIPGGPAPVLAETPDLVIPALDKDLVKEETRKAAAPGIRSLRRSTRAALRKHVDTTNPAIKREMFRAILQGHGGALSQIFGGAQKTGMSVAQQERQAQTQQAVINFQAKQQRNQIAFQAAMQAYMSKFGQRSTTTKKFDGGNSLGMGSKIVPTQIGSVSGMATGFRRV